MKKTCQGYDIHNINQFLQCNQKGLTPFVTTNDIAAVVRFKKSRLFVIFFHIEFLYKNELNIQRIDS